MTAKESGIKVDPEVDVYTNPAGDSISNVVDASGVDGKALLRKMDLRFIPWLSFMYFLSFLDRTSIGNAKLYGLETDIHITDRQYLTTLTIFFISYWACEVPSNIFLKRLRPSVWLPICMTAWGICMMAQGFVRDFGGLLTVRWLLGVFEAGFFPGVTYFFSCWYHRSELGFRTAVFSSMATVSGAFGGLLAAAIHKMDGLGSKPGWAWIFILEGIVTVIAGIMSFWIIVDFPDSAKFITEAERKFITERLADDEYNTREKTFKMKYFWQSVQDPKTWLSMLIAAGYDGPLYAFALFTPSIINQVSFKATTANLLSVPIYFFACILTCIVGYYADRLGNRGYLNMAFLSAGIAGYLILVVSRNAALSYFAIYLAAAGIYPAIANSTTWYANNSEGSYKRGITIAMAIGFGNLQGAVASNVYRAQDTPWYTLGHAVQLGYITMSFIATATLIIMFRVENNKRDLGERDEVIITAEKRQDLDEKTELRGRQNGFYESVDEARKEKGDRWSGYRYHL